MLLLVLPGSCWRNCRNTIVFCLNKQRIATCLRMGLFALKSILRRTRVCQGEWLPMPREKDGEIDLIGCVKSAVSDSPVVGSQVTCLMCMFLTMLYWVSSVWVLVPLPAWVLCVFFVLTGLCSEHVELWVLVRMPLWLVISKFGECE